MLVASTSIGLLAPIIAHASDTVNLDDINNYKSSHNIKRFDSKTFANDVNGELADLNSRIEKPEAKQNDFEASSFSETTTLDGKAVFTIGSADTRDDAMLGYVQAMYTYQMNLKHFYNP